MMSQRCLRQKPRISYFEPEEPSLDEYVFCEKCADYVYEYCSLHGALLVIPDDKISTKPNFPSYVPRAALTVPHVFLHLNYSSIPGAGLGVFTTLTLPCGVRFGPYRGERTKEITSDYSWQIYDRNNKPCYVVDAADGNRSNWMRYVNCARHWTEQNLVAFQYQGQLYYRTIRIIPRFTELMVFYGSEYAHILRIDLGKYNSPKSYAQKFGAPAPKKPIFGVKSKKPLQELVSKPPEKGKHCSTKANTNITTTSCNVKKDISKNAKCPQEAKPQPETGPPAPKKRKLNKTTQPENLASPIEKTSENAPVGIDNPNAEKLCKEALRKAKKAETKTKSRKEIKIADKKEKNETISPTSTMCQENVVKSNLSVIEAVDDNTKSSENNSHEEKSSSNSDINRQITSKRQNEVSMCIQDAYFNCDTCNYQSVTKEKLEKHMRRHDVYRMFACDDCTFRFPDKNRLIEHELRVHNIKTSSVKIQECNICEYTTVYQSRLKIHLLKHAGLKRFACNVCHYKTAQLGNLKTHIRTHTGEKPYSCNKCEYRTNWSNTLKNHLRTHTGEKPYSCNKCEYRTNQSGSLQTHLRTHTGEKPYSCNKCEYRTSRSGILKTHLRTHTGEKPYSCNKCEYRTTQSGALQTHLRTHTGEKPYSCNKCEYRTNWSNTLKNHLRTHTGEKPYSCNKCEYRTTRSDVLQTHLRTHTGEKPYSCNKCEYRTTNSSALKVHLRTHTGEKPYSCNLCEYRTTWRSALKRHLRTQHVGKKAQI